MAIKKIGSISDRYADGIAMQPDRRLTFKDDGTIDGTIVYECERANVGNLPAKGSQHPDDSRLELYAHEITYLRLDKVRMTASYFGIESKETEPVLSATTDPDRLPIVLHPSFVTTLGGTASAPENGASYHPETGEFLGFFDETSDLFGVEYYFQASVQVTLSYWSRAVPNIKRLMTIHPSIRRFRKPDGVKDFLLVGSPYRQVGTHYQVTETYLGSGPGGWNTKIYT